MMRKSKRELERELETLSQGPARETASGHCELSEGDKRDVRTVLRYRQQVAAETGVRLDIEDDRAVFTNLLATAREHGTPGELEVPDVEAAADRIGFSAGEAA